MKVNNIKLIILISAIIPSICLILYADITTLHIYITMLINSMSWIGIGIIEAIEIETKEN